MAWLRAELHKWKPIYAVSSRGRDHSCLLRNRWASNDAAYRRPLLKLMRLEQHVGGQAAVLAAAHRRRQLLGCMIPEQQEAGSAAGSAEAHPTLAPQRKR